jgi:hypothetical protein
MSKDSVVYLKGFCSFLCSFGWSNIRNLSEPGATLRLKRDMWNRNPVVEKVIKLAQSFSMF